LSTRAAQEIHAIAIALSFTREKRFGTWSAYLEWLDISIESAMRHTVAS
jgi:hypothetical protein